MLPAGARIAVVAPSGIFNPTGLERGLDLLRAWGYRPEPMPGLGQTHRYLAGPDAVRLRDLSQALRGGWDAVWATRGGYGITRLLLGLPWGEMSGAPFIGFSDATPLLNAMAGRGIPGVHGPVLHSLADRDEASIVHLRALLAGQPLEPMEGIVLRSGTASGPLVGGNLCMLASVCGTRWQLRAKGCILVLEDVGEVPYKVDRLLSQLIDAGCLDGVEGVALGEFLGAAAPEGADWSVLDVIDEILAPLGVPVLAGLPIGHGLANRAFVVGGPGRIAGGRLELG